VVDEVIVAEKLEFFDTVELQRPLEVPEHAAEVGLPEQVGVVVVVGVSAVLFE